MNLKKKLISPKDTFLLDVSLEIKNNTITTIYGQSGAGKSSLLRVISGLSKPEHGYLEVNNQLWFDSNKKINLPPQKRKIGYVFQDYALFPNMSVIENLRFAMNNKNEAGYIEYLLKVTNLLSLRDRMPDTLSGGQKQRVALARALVRKPSLLLLDEPLSALDQSMRSALQDEIIRIKKELSLTVILISHDYSEIIKMSDYACMLEHGKIIKSGKPLELFSDTNISGKFKFSGEIAEIKKMDLVFVLTVAIGNNLVRIVAMENEIQDLKPGDKVIVASKAFNPIIIKIRD